MVAAGRRFCNFFAGVPQNEAPLYPPDIVGKIERITAGHHEDEYWFLYLKIVVPVSNFHEVKENVKDKKTLIKLNMFSKTQKI